MIGPSAESKPVSPGGNEAQLVEVKKSQRPQCLRRCSEGGTSKIFQGAKLMADQVKERADV